MWASTVMSIQTAFCCDKVQSARHVRSSPNSHGFGCCDWAGFFFFFFLTSGATIDVWVTCTETKSIARQSSSLQVQEGVQLISPLDPLLLLDRAYPSGFGWNVSKQAYWLDTQIFKISSMSSSCRVNPNHLLLLGQSWANCVHVRSVLTIQIS